MSLSTISMPDLPIKPKTYQWSQTASFPPVWKRRALSFESAWCARPKDARDIFIYCSLRLITPSPSLASLSRAAKNAWRELNFEVPELGIRSVWEDGKAIMQWSPPGNEEEAEKVWGRNFVCLQETTKPMGFEELRNQLSVKIRTIVDANTFLLLHPQVDREGDGLVRDIQLILYTDHKVTDGIGIRILLGKYLALLASTLAKETWRIIDWADSHNNLSPPGLTGLKESIYSRDRILRMQCNPIRMFYLGKW